MWKDSVDVTSVVGDAHRDGLHRLGEHVLLDHLLCDRDAGTIERLVKNETAWNLNEKCFLSKHDAVWARHGFDERQSFPNIPQLEILRGKGKKLIEKTYNTVVGTRFEIKATKMVTGQWVGIHNDSPDGARGRTESYRFLYYPNREYVDSDGGHLLFYSASDVGAIIDCVRPVFNSAVLMCLSDHSYHAVSEVTAGVRYTVAFLYWGYPILFEDERKREVVAKCLRKIIAAGFEEVRYSGTTLAYHLYHTYRLLTEWDAPFALCLAGLMRSVPGCHGPEARPIEISRAEVEELLDEDAVRVVRRLNCGRSNGNVDLDRGTKLVELASILEQAEDNQSIARAYNFVANIDGLDDKTRRKIELEVSRLRAEVASAAR